MRRGFLADKTRRVLVLIIVRIGEGRRGRFGETKRESWRRECADIKRAGRERIART